MSNSFFDILGIAVAFLSVVLLLSVVVTALVQLTQSWLGLRGRNLRFSIGQLLKDMREDKDRDDSKANADKLLDSTPASLLTRKADSLPGRLFGPGVSWIEPAELPQALAKSEVVLTDQQKEELPGRFQAMAPAMDKRLQRWMRLVTVVWALGVAFVLQVSTPRLLSELSAAPQLRASVLVQNADLDALGESVERLESYQDVAERALGQLEEAYGDDAEALIEEAAGVGGDRTAIVAELGRVLAGHPQRDAILADYEARLDAMRQEGRKAALDEAARAMERLALLGIQPWADPDFYRDERGVRWGNVLGVAMTGVLLTFGAPFWFRRLKEVAGLRDALKSVLPGGGPAPPTVVAPPAAEKASPRDDAEQPEEEK